MLCLAANIAKNSTFMVAFALAMIGYRPFNIPSEAMRPTLEPGNYLMIKPPIYNEQGNIRIKRGDVIVFRKMNDETSYIKRVIGLPNDTVQMVNGQVKLNGAILNQQITAQETLTDVLRQQYPVTRLRETIAPNKSYEVYNFYDNGPFDNTPELIVPPDMYFVLGDNRDNSTDSRMDEILHAGIGLVRETNIVGVNGYKMAEFDDSETSSPQEKLSHIHWYAMAKKIE